MTRSGRDVGEELLKELGRISQLNPFEVLGIGPNATQDEVRAAFLAATKKYHPNKFARESSTTVEAANELFLVIRRAYAQLNDDTKRRRWKQKLGSASVAAVPVRGRKGSGPLEPAPPPSVSAVASVVAAPSPQAAPAPQAAPSPAPRAPGTQPPGGRAPGTQPLPSRLAPGTQPPSGAPNRPADLRPPATPVPRGRPAATSPAPGRTSPPVRLGSPAPSGGPPTSPTSGRTTAEVRALLELAKTRTQRYELGSRHLAKNRLREAKDVFSQLVAEDPQSRRFRVKLILAQALELREQGRLEEATRELERAAALDPDAGDVVDALKKTQDMRRGIFSKLFGR